MENAQKVGRPKNERFIKRKRVSFTIKPKNHEYLSQKSLELQISRGQLLDNLIEKHAEIQK